MTKMALSCVARERCSVSSRLRLTMVSKVLAATSPMFSRMRSKTTITSCTEKPMTVRTAVRNRESTSQPATSPRTLAMPSRNEDIVEHLGDGADAIAQGVGNVAKGKGDKEQDGGRRRQDGQSSGARRLAADGGADTLKAQLGRRAKALLELIERGPLWLRRSISWRG
jgi:hypothetical protein